MLFREKTPHFYELTFHYNAKLSHDYDLATRNNENFLIKMTCNHKY